MVCSDVTPGLYVTIITLMNHPTSPTLTRWLRPCPGRPGRGTGPRGAMPGASGAGAGPGAAGAEGRVMTPAGNPVAVLAEEPRQEGTGAPQSPFRRMECRSGAACTRCAGIVGARTGLGPGRGIEVAEPGGSFAGTVSREPQAEATAGSGVADAGDFHGRVRSRPRAAVFAGGGASSPVPRRPWGRGTAAGGLRLRPTGSRVGSAGRARSPMLQVGGSPSGGAALAQGHGFARLMNGPAPRSATHVVRLHGIRLTLCVQHHVLLTFCSNFAQVLLCLLCLWDIQWIVGVRDGCDTR